MLALRVVLGAASSTEFAVGRSAGDVGLVFGHYLAVPRDDSSKETLTVSLEDLQGNLRYPAALDRGALFRVFQRKLPGVKGARL